MKPKIYIAMPVPSEVESYLAGYCEYGIWRRNEPIPRERLLEEVADVDGLLVQGSRIDEELLRAALKLKAVSNVSVGYNNFDLEAMQKRGVIGTHTPSVLDETVADLVLGLMLASARRIPELDRMVKHGKWVKGNDEALWGTDVHHAVLGIIGMGRIGEAIAKRAGLGFAMNVLYCNRNRRPNVEQTLGVRYAEMNELLRESDFVVLMTPLTPETDRFFGWEQFKQMKQSAIFINVSRGGTVREEDLLRALQEGSIRGAGLDVFAREPVDPANPLLGLPNVVTVPHIGSATGKTRFAIAMLAAQNLAAAVTGQLPPNVVAELRS